MSRPVASPRPEAFADVAVTYPQVGATANPTMPTGYRHIDQSLVLGRGADLYGRAVEALATWQLLRHAGLSITTTGPRAALGAIVVQRLGIGPLRLVAPCRVVRVIAEGDAGGFAYGSLPGHPATGEEAFVVSIDPSGQVTFTVRSFSRPATWYARTGRPVTHLAQTLAVRRYLTTLRRLAQP